MTDGDKPIISEFKGVSIKLDPWFKEGEESEPILYFVNPSRATQTLIQENERLRAYITQLEQRLAELE